MPISAQGARTCARAVGTKGVGRILRCGNEPRYQNSNAAHREGYSAIPFSGLSLSPIPKRRFANLPAWEQRGNNKRFSLLWPLLNAPKNTRKYLMLHRCVH
jgi:hypothetical protein